MDRVGAGGRGRRDDEVATQVGIGVRIGVDGDGGEAERVRGLYYPGRDLAAVGDQQLGDGCGHQHHIRKTPKPRRPATGPLCTADRARPRTVRVSRGSMMPSSYRRAVTKKECDSASIWASIAAVRARSAFSSNGRPVAAAEARPTMDSTPASWAAPITASLALGQANMKRGS